MAEEGGVWWINPCSVCAVCLTQESWGVSTRARERVVLSSVFFPLLFD